MCGERRLQKHSPADLHDDSPVAVWEKTRVIIISVPYITEMLCICTIPEAHDCSRDYQYDQENVQLKRPPRQRVVQVADAPVGLVTAPHFEVDLFGELKRETEQDVCFSL